MRYLRGLQAQILLWTILPLILILVAVSFGSITLHQQSMRSMVAERDAFLAELAASRLDDNLRARVLALVTIGEATRGSDDGAVAPPA
jgi:signal transduction histidine kinase